jgi:hypothetical protein
MARFSIALIALCLMGAKDEAPANPPGTGEIAPETRVEPKRSDSAPELRWRLMIGLRLHGPRFSVQGDGTKNWPFLLDLPVGDFFKVRIVMPCVFPPRDGNLYY